MQVKRVSVWISTIASLFTSHTNQFHKLILFLVYWKWSSCATISHFTWRWSCSSLAYLVVWHEESANGTVWFLFCTSCVVLFFSIEIVYSCLPKVDQRPGPCLCLLNFLFNQGSLRQFLKNFKEKKKVFTLQSCNEDNQQFCHVC